MSVPRYTLDIDSLTVIYVDQHGERVDINSAGYACESVGDLEGLVWDLWSFRIISWQVRDDLLSDLDDYRDSLED